MRFPRALKNNPQCHPNPGTQKKEKISGIISMCVCVCNMTMIIRHDFLCLKISMVVLCAAQCVKVPFFVQKLQILEKFEKFVKIDYF